MEGDADRLAGPGRSVYGLPRPQPAERLEMLVHDFPVPSEVVRRQDEVVGMPPAGESQAGPPAGEVVDDRPLLGHPDGVVQGQHDRAGVQPDPRGARSHGRRQHRRAGEQAAERVEMPLREPDGVQAGPVGELRDPQQACVAGRCVRIRIVAEEEDAEVAGTDGVVRRRQGHRRWTGGLRRDAFRFR
jgi:hypothetical protein